ETGAPEVQRERQADVAQPDDADQRRSIVGLGHQHVGGGRGGLHSGTGAPPAARERVAASSTRTTRTPSSALARGGSVPRATRTKCPSPAASGSMFGILGMKMSPSRIARPAPYEPYSSERSTPVS